MSKSPEEKIRELERKIRRLKEQQKKGESGGAAGSMLHGLSELVPGLGKMLEGLENSPAFQERLEEINKQIDKKIKQAPFKRTQQKRDSSGRNSTGFKGNFSVRTSSQSKKSSSKTESAKKEREVLVDIFDEREYVRVTAEVPGVEEKDIKVKIQNKTLVILANTLRHRYYKKVQLPCPVTGEKKRKYKNGILEIELEKKK